MHKELELHGSEAELETPVHGYNAVMCPFGERKADRQTDRQTCRQTDRQTDRQTGRQRYTLYCSVYMCLYNLIHIVIRYNMLSEILLWCSRYW